jgi:hypothetical protein
LSATQYKIILNGVQPGRSTDEVAAAFAKLMKIDAAKAAQFFTGEPRVIKKQADEATAEKYLKALDAIGADCSKEPLEPAVAPGLELDLEPIKDGEEEAADGPRMICPGCKTLQPRVEQCPACGIYVEKARQLRDTLGD